MIKTLLIESIKEITKCIRGIFDKRPKEGNCKIAVLFSGGIDSTLIARLLDMNLPKE
jgi:asparagine synthetase B (glutamine-hydrolysing)